MRKINRILIVIGFSVGIFNILLAQEQPLNRDWTQVEKQLEKLTKKGIPGIVFGLKKEGESYFVAKGWANIANNEPMTIVHAHYLQSISKTYLATAVLKLAEEETLNLDKKIAVYLPDSINHWLTWTDQITVRMLLNHSSGVPEYNLLPEYITILLQEPEYPFETTDYIKYLEGKKLDFQPGSKFSYRNSNYLILALILDHVVGDHARFIREEIFEKIGLKETFYRNSPDYLDLAHLPSSYWDRYGNGIVEDATALQKYNVGRLVGDDGIVCTPADGIRFLEALMEFELIDESSLVQMKTWISDKNGAPTFGLGLDYTSFAGQEAWGHSGGGIGAGSNLYYFPKQDVYIFMAINLGTVTSGPIHLALEKEVEILYQLVFETLEKTN